MEKESAAFPHSKTGPDLQMRSRGVPDLRGWLMGLVLCQNNAKIAAVDKDVPDPQGLDPSPASWVSGWEISV